MKMVRNRFKLVSRLCRSYSIASLLAVSNSTQEGTDRYTVTRVDIRKLTGDDPQAQNSLSRLLERVAKGQDVNYTSPIANNMTPEEILAGWDRIFEQGRSKRNKVLDSKELSQRDKFGTRSKAKPWSERREDFYNSFGKGGDFAKVVASKLGPSGRLRPLSIEKAASYLKNNANSGLPYMKRKSLVKDDAIRNVNEQYGVYPCVPFTRTQELGKTRLIKGYPIADTLVEMQFYRPILEVQSKQPWRAALRNPASLDEAMNKLIQSNKERDQYLFSGDISGFDDSAKSFLQQVTFKSFKDLYQRQYHARMDEIQDRFEKIPIITPDGLVSGSHGIPSGSVFTNETGSTIQYNVLDSYKCCSMDFLQLQGDDSALSCANPDKVFEAYMDVMLRINPDKSDVSKEYCTYLQFLYHPDFRTTNGLIGGVYPTYRALNRIVHMENFDDISGEGISGKDYFAIRTISILENCKHHPQFRDLVRYIWEIDKYKLLVSDLGLRQFVELKRKQEGKDIQFSRYTYGDDISGIRNFEAFKIIKELNL